MYCCAENVIAAPFVQPVYQLVYRFIVARRSSTSQQTLYKNLGFCIRLSGPALLAEALGTYASPAGLVRPPLPRLAYCGLRPRVLQGEVSPCEPLWPASQLILAKKIRLSQRIVRHVLCHDPCPESSGHGYRIFLSAGWPEWAGKNRSNPNRFLRPAAGRVFSFGFWFLVFGFWFLVFGFARVARSIKPCRRSRHCFFGPFVPARSLPKPIASFG